ncbi:hypothetical protein A3I95_03610 [Candidatus Nomurabacteria bacterium RIFCSPLOWO2_02_FULL_44_12]|uniref:UDP-N-acetylmuramate--L-alanine ligase n=1 Tax=Candidatus Nomurabacteria bacterium RIFCSPLOWO2_12_FULL_44_11 TaxID=1801796 RepID=A0A1F6Y7Y9_9BACT|nr:MAG: hypothetical protein A3E95_01805 [Candidatus Nomurabacteria bacterium RIFCSPHIGHO2_12_FULL_44_22b]OGJ02487.1 MAG: hypothetical protein A3G53_01160 [Candidatus Nomurabacteria bacterium RIFCSPLOWO2_12_FULL_44_11]OGJ06895.1 MAG: hypothetical protein A3I95_03610 [Candidatus Nomurabacteria bacterium RIFCSPLOWO2_02_FULL_44_12]
MTDLNLLKVNKVFFIGIGGIGISAGAQLALARGMEVSGVNDEEGKTTELLKQKGIKIIYLKDFKNLPEADMYVFSDAWIYRGPEIIEAAKKTGKPVLSYFEFLGIISKEYKVIAIAGTHGKTTTTAMVAEILIDAGLDPTVVVGSFMKEFNSNFRKGNSPYLVVEADEYNRHFLNFNPFIGVVTNIEADHLDYYKDLADIENAFNQFVAQSENVIVNYTKYLRDLPKLSVPGLHNQVNAAAALAIADFLKVDKKKAKKSLAEFSGTWRRLEKRGETKNGTIIYDDYAHHPTEIKASIQVLRELYPPKQKIITIVFQPHLYSRTRALFDDFAKSFKGADRIFLLPIYFAREDPDPEVSSNRLAEAIIKNGEEAQSFPDFESAERAVLTLNLGPNDVLVTMGAGEAYKVADKVFGLTF